MQKNRLFDLRQRLQRAFIFLRDSIVSGEPAQYTSPVPVAQARPPVCKPVANRHDNPYRPYMSAQRSWQQAEEIYNGDNEKERKVLAQGSSS